MKQERAHAIVERLLDAFRLRGWSLRFVDFSEPHRLGLCSYQFQTIKLSNRHLAEDSDNDVIETIAEEVAHALEPGAAHGPRWKNARRYVWQKLLEMDESIPRSSLWYIRHGRE